MNERLDLSYGTDSSLLWIVGILVVGTIIGLQVHKLFRGK